MTGAQGHQGQPGTNAGQGAQGDPGAQGNQGQPGTNAGQGAQGSPGGTGAQGSPGGTGAQGSPGSTGAQGADGDANAQLTIFTSSGTFTPPSGTSSYIVWVTGGGGYGAARGEHDDSSINAFSGSAGGGATVMVDIVLPKWVHRNQLQLFWRCW